MMLERLVVFVEELSMEIALEQMLPPMLGDIDFDVHRFQCKDDLLKNLPDRLRGYRAWLPDNWAILVLVDRDDEDCLQLKRRLDEIALRAGLTTRTVAGHGDRFQVMNRIVIEELEAWFFGDWQAVKTAYPRVSQHVPQQAGFRAPDAIAGGTWEAMERILKRAGYFKGGLRKLELAREVTQHMDPAKNTSPSFQTFRNAVLSAAQWGNG